MSESIQKSIFRFLNAFFMKVALNIQKTDFGYLLFSCYTNERLIENDFHYGGILR